MDSIYGYIDAGSEELQGICKCNTNLSDLLIDEKEIKEIVRSNKIEHNLICSVCDRDIIIKKINLLVDLRCLKSIKNKLERRCISLILDTGVYNILINNMEIFDYDINVAVTEISYNNFELIFNGEIKYMIYINSLDIKRAFSRFNVEYLISTKEEDLTFSESIYY